MCITLEISFKVSQRRVFRILSAFPINGTWTKHKNVYNSPDIPDFSPSANKIYIFSCCTKFVRSDYFKDLVFDGGPNGEICLAFH